MPLRVVYKCADGTDFPVDWEDPADAQQFWVSMRDHKPRPNLPIESSHGSDWRSWGAGDDRRDEQGLGADDAPDRGNVWPGDGPDGFPRPGAGRRPIADGAGADAGVPARHA